MRGMSYEKSGVSQRLGDDVSEIMANACRMTYGNPAIGEVYKDGNTPPYYMYPKLDRMQVGSNTDGVGTKIEVAERVGDHSTVFFDLLAMLCDDASRYGGIPVYATNIIDWNHPSKRIARQLAKGMISACEKARIAMLNGENAELGGRIGGHGSHSYNLGGAVTWVREYGGIITGKDVHPGDKIIAYREKGFRSNGFTLIRKLAEKYLGQDWHKKRFGRRTWGRMVLEPSTIYTPAWVDTFDGEGVKFIAHVTGGGIPGKFGKALKKACGCGAVLEDLWEPSEAMLELQGIGKLGDDMVTDEAAYRAWNMGNGGLLVTDKPELAIGIASEYGIEARVCGRVREKPWITLVSRGRWRGGKEIEFGV